MSSRLVGERAWEAFGISVKFETGMLASAETIKVVADALRRFSVQNVVVDPVRLPPARDYTYNS